MDIKLILWGPHKIIWGPHLGSRAQVWEPLLYAIENRDVCLCLRSVCFIIPLFTHGDIHKTRWGLTRPGNGSPCVVDGHACTAHRVPMWLC